MADSSEKSELLGIIWSLCIVFVGVLVVPVIQVTLFPGWALAGLIVAVIVLIVGLVLLYRSFKRYRYAPLQEDVGMMRDMLHTTVNDKLKEKN